MRNVFVLVIAAVGCGRVKSSVPEPEGPPDASTADATGCTVRIVDPEPPRWMAQGPFRLVGDPAGGPAQVWASIGSVPSSAAFVVPFKAGDRIVGLTFTGYGTGDPMGGLLQLEAIYQPVGLPYQILSRSEDIGRDTKWGDVAMSSLDTPALSAGAVWVQFFVTEVGYYIGMVTPVLERPCSRL